MPIIDRKTPPLVHPPLYKAINPPERSVLQNGINLYSFNSGDQEVFRVELLFNSGSAASKNIVIPGISLTMLREGTKSRSGAELNNLLDYYGAFLDLKSGLDHSTVTLYGRSEFIDTLIPVLCEIILQPKFAEDSLEKQKSKTAQNISINQKKTSYWAPRLLRKQLFGSDHPYGKIIDPESIASISKADLEDFHNSKLLPSLHSIIVAGAYPKDSIERLFDHHLRDLKIHSSAEDVKFSIDSNNKVITKTIEDTNQASLALGITTANNRDIQHPGNALLIKLFGGYFGSRLMKSLREKEGLTYGIHAYTLELKDYPFMQISADVELSSVDKSIELIFKEMDLLRSQKVDKNELSTVQNYMIGEHINESNNVFEFASLYKKLVLQDLPDDYYHTFYDGVGSISPDMLNSLANQLLIPSNFTVVKVL